MSHASTPLVDTICRAFNQGPEERRKLAELSDQIVAEAGGELSADEKDAITRFGLDLGAAARAKAKTRKDDVVAGLVALARTVPGAGDRIVRFAAQLEPTALLSAGQAGTSPPVSAFNLGTTIPQALTAADHEACVKFGMDPAVALRAAQNQARARSR